MDGTEVMEVEDFGAMATAFRNDEVEALMKMTGQGSVQKEWSVFLASTSTTRQRRTTASRWFGERGRCITRAELFTPAMCQIRPLLRTYEYSLWDVELNEGRGGFRCQVSATDFVWGHVPG